MQLLCPNSELNKILDQSANSQTTLELKAIRTRLNKILKKQYLSGLKPTTFNDGRIKKMAVRNSLIEPLILLWKNDQDHEKITELSQNSF